MHKMKKIGLSVAGACLLISAPLSAGADKSATQGTAQNRAENAQNPIDYRHEQPNIILITAEDLSLRFSSFGDKVAHTPHIDRLASQGISYPNVFTTAGVCAPSRSSLITGVQQQTLGTMHMRTSSYGTDMDKGEPYEAVPPAQIKAFPELLRAAGYYTVNRHKTDYQFGEPFTIWDENSPDADWQGRKTGQPFFAMINFNETHESYSWPPNATPLKPYMANVLKRNAQSDARIDFPLTNPDNVEVPPYYPDTPEVRANIARYYDNVQLMDKLVGELLDELEKAGRFQDSIIIFTTDHGDGLPRAKRTIYDSGLKVPMIVRFPDGYGAGTTRHEMVSFTDIAPTILAMAHSQLPQWIQGRDIYGESKKRDYIYASADRFDEVTQRRKLVRNENFAYIRNYITDQPPIPSLSYQNMNPIMQQWRALGEQGKLTKEQAYWLYGPLPDEELYDLKNDPYQVHNLAKNGAYSPTLLTLRAELSRWSKATNDLSFLPEAELRNRIWPNGIQPDTSAPKACRLRNQSIILSSQTQGASIGWQDDAGHWQLYRKPIFISEPFKTKAIRYGYKESPVMTMDVKHIAYCE